MQGNFPSHFPAHFAACGARTRSGTACRAPAMSNGRCRMHGGLSSGPPPGNQNALKHGQYSAEAIATRRRARALVRQMRATIAAMK
ncbi:MULTISPECIES: HGGxSTG domain-containing protein [unclassified Beijerinckia]|uniref:HGGxSTG domain-containing protein n=1 Tax=unclassified Beijerinckia TaxID=2638183 RepID=UPI0008989A60|nr:MULTISPECIES: HGGxSTG domain-containing protein [unclassified Beijerinckia]MDH7797151.1 hypothetical protein [Beijerinckia sp. GAS462]SEC74215.1 hypothetical protein SAMN05443249_3443 [Beijerinckia sp. 28-YEA-48]